MESSPPPAVASEPDRQWRGRSHGGGFGTALVRQVARWGGRDLCYVFLLFPALWFSVADRRARSAVIDYWRRMRPEQPRWRAALRVPFHFWRFACGLADRLLASVPRAVIRTTDGFEQMIEAMRHPRGCIILSAHVGSFELSARWMARFGSAQATASAAMPRFNLVMMDAEDPRVQAELAKTMGDRPYAVIDLRDPTTAALAVASALNRGETCCMLGDRTAGDASATVAVPFLGGIARFPTGPFIAAAATGAVIVPAFCCRAGWARWHCQADAPWTIDLGPRSQRRERLRHEVARWAARVEAQVRAHPWDWNNYFPFWEAGQAATPAEPAVSPAAIRDGSPPLPPSR
ncbi:hypothetical protein LBMAG53_13110 [Planctomycetota bacterium]|nr:hypothetical protein LBMAG53_13110 [Planctomycetota bacterium]